MRISDWSSDVCSSDLYNGKEDHADNEDEHLFHDLATATNTPALSFADVAAKAALSMFMLRGIEIHEREYAIKAEYAQDKYAENMLLAVIADAHRLSSLDNQSPVTRLGIASASPLSPWMAEAVAKWRSEERRDGKGGVSTCRSRW